MGSNMGDGSFDQPPQYSTVDIGEAIDVRAVHAVAVLAQSPQKVLIPFESPRNIEGEAALTRRKSGLEPISPP